MEKFFPNSDLVILTDNDFNLDFENDITLKSKSCCIILFYTDNKEDKESQILLQLWKLCLDNLPNHILAVCNLTIESIVPSVSTSLRISNAFKILKKNAPFIIVYRNGQPKGFYIGTRSLSAILSFILSQTCSSFCDEICYPKIATDEDQNIKKEEPILMIKNKPESEKIKNNI